MKLTKKDKSDLKESAVLSEAPEFPWGLSVNLDEDSLEKLKVEKLPEVGDEFEMIATVKATAVSENEDEDGTRRSVSLQITDMALFHAGDKGKPEDRLYGGKKS